MNGVGLADPEVGAEGWEEEDSQLCANKVLAAVMDAESRCF